MFQPFDKGPSTTALSTTVWCQPVDGWTESSSTSVLTNDEAPPKCVMQDRRRAAEPIQAIRAGGRVKRWQNGTMVLRWTAAGVFEAERGFRKLTGYRALPTPTSLRFEAFSGEVRKLRACSSDAHGPSARRTLKMVSRCASR
jgi:hypothetical protein